MALRRKMRHHRNFGVKLVGNTRYLTVPWPPSINSYWRRSGYTTYIGPIGKRFLARFVELMGDCDVPVLTIDFDLKLTAVFYPPDDRGRDLDNIPKVMIDSIVKMGIMDNDKQIRWMDIRFGHKVKGGRVDVIIQILDDSGNPVD
jgi:crossover junction endodeoxyribonuclease RusA